ncbi:hypothetical protein MAR_016002 [Mya arenaria]|uniref:Uncharacterized protein n=1 Tax=Mya arenaria TaxID=6604 RepID=A0ABY7FMX2_MYAAR|nr:hypothetical protein MAR_016002 [Mya arenaria]
MARATSMESNCIQIWGNLQNLHSKPIIHGKQYEETARKKFEAETGLTVQRGGLYICHQKLWSDMFIKPGKSFPFLEYDSQGNVVLRQTSNYYYQIQGQLFISKRKYCYFIVYTFKDTMIQK